MLHHLNNLQKHSVLKFNAFPIPDYILQLTQLTKRVYENTGHFVEPHSDATRISKMKMDLLLMVLNFFPFYYTSLHIVRIISFPSLILKCF